MAASKCAEDQRARFLWRGSNSVSIISVCISQAVQSRIELESIFENISPKKSVQFLSCAAAPETSVVNTHSNVSQAHRLVPMLQEFNGQRHTRPLARH